MAFAFYSSFCKCTTRGRKIRIKKNEETEPIFEVAYLGNALIKFGMWSAEVGGHFHSKNRLVSSRKHRATEVQKLLFFLLVNILTGVTRRLLGLHDILPCVLIWWSQKCF